MCDFVKKNGVAEKEDVVVVETKTHEVIEDIRGTSSSGDDIATPGPLEPSKAPAHPLISFWRRRKECARYHETATQPSVFDDPVTAATFAPPASYENAHRFDPSCRWTWGEELPLVARLDMRVAFWSMVTMIVFDMNRTNLIQANTDNFLEDLGMDTNDYNLGNTVFRITTMTIEIPMQLISRKIGL